MQLNQTGYLPESAKIAQVPGNVGGVFQIVDAGSGQVVQEFPLGSSGFWSPANATYTIADFSSFNTPGSYRINVPGSGDTSHPFDIGQSVYDDVAQAALKFYYYQRSSTEITGQHGGQWSRPFGHADNNVQVHSSAAGGRPAGSFFSAPKGWYDAGDYGKYTVNSGISTWTLMSFYEFFPEYAADFEVNIPESGNGVPDILDEARWNLEWLLNMQDPGDGGVYHKMTTLGFSGRQMPHDADGLQRFVIGKATAATFDFAAMMAQAARVYQPFDPGFANQCLLAAERAWGWGSANDNISFTNPGDVATGEYGDSNLEDEKRWAAIELYITTGNDFYWNQANLFGQGMTTPAWPQVGPLAYLSLIANRDNLTPAANVGQIEQAVINFANSKVGEVNGSPYQVVNTPFNWGNNANFLNDGMIALIAYTLTQNGDYLKVAQTGLDYVMGKNPLNFSYFTGFGESRSMQPHHRPSDADGIFEPVPGMVIGGAQNEANPDAGDCNNNMGPNIPALRYIDDWCSYSTNEVTINWNAPMVFVANGLLAVGNVVCPNPAPITVSINNDAANANTELGSQLQLNARAANECGGTVNDAVLVWSGNAPGGLFTNTGFEHTEIVTVTIQGTNISDDIEINVVPENATLLSDSENGGLTLLDTEWFSFNDDANGGASVVDPFTNDGEVFPMTAGGADGTANRAEISYSLDQGSMEFQPFVGFGFPLTTDETAIGSDFESSTGVSFYHRGDACVMKVPMTSVTDFDYYSASIPAHADWTLVELDWNQFSQAGWGAAVAFDATAITNFQWEKQGETGASGVIAVDQIKVEGVVLDIGCDTPEVAAIEIVPGNNQSVVLGNPVALAAIVRNGCGQVMADEPVNWEGAPGGIFPADQLGSFVVTASAANAVSFSDQLTITVTEVPNQVPEANAGNDVSLFLPDNTTMLSGSGTDGDNDPLTFAWSQASGPNTANIVSPAAASTDLIGLIEGSYEFVLTVSDGEDTGADTVAVTVATVNANNMLTNGDYSNGLASWTSFIGGSGASNQVVNNGEFNSQISNGGFDVWNVQLYQGGLLIENGADYRLTFDARATGSRTIESRVEKNGNPWTEYFGATINLSASTQSFSFEFTMNQATDNNGRVTFNMGLSATDVFIDNVVLEKLGGIDPGNDAPIGKIIAIRAEANGRWVVAENGGNEFLRANRDAIGGWEQFEIVDAGSGNIGIRAMANGKFVAAEDAGASNLTSNRDAIGGWEQFKWIDNGDGTFALQAVVNGRYVVAEDGGNAPLIANRDAIGGWERFTYQEMGKARFGDNVLSTESETAAQLTNATQLSLYPNPVADQLTIGGIEEGDAKIQVYGPSGRLHINQVLGGFGERSLRVNHLKPGLYLIKIQAGQLDQTLRFVKR